MDWNKLKAEYIAGGTSYRKLADKYGVSFNTLKTIAIKGKWNELKQQANNKATTKIVNVVSDGIVNHALKINEIADKLLDKISKTLDESEFICGQEIKHYTSALKDIKDIKGIRSEMDLEEQQARIDKLRKEAKDDDSTDNEIKIIIGEEGEKYAN